MKIDVKTENCSSMFLKMLAWMEVCSHIGHSTGFNVWVDGDGSADLKFEPMDPDVKKAYNDLKKEIIKQRDETGKDIKGFDFE